MLSDAPLAFDRREGKHPATRITSLSGPLTLRNHFEIQASLRSEPEPRVAIFDLSQVPYMDSAGMGVLINHYVHCQKCGIKMIVAGVSNRVLELFKLTKVDTVIAIAATTDEAESRA
jgi:anti-anti-sigma factor